MPVIMEKMKWPDIFYLKLNEIDWDAVFFAVRFLSSGNVYRQNLKCGHLHWNKRKACCSLF